MMMDSAGAWDKEHEMELMDEQEMIRKAYFDATQASGLPPQWIYEFALNLLAAHNAETQEPVAWMRDAGEDSISTMTCCCTDAVKQLWLKVNPEQVERYTIPLYAHPQPQPMTDAARDVLAERYRQVTAEGWTPAHDDEHTGCSLAVAAACYALFAAADNSDSADAWIQEWRKTARCLWPYDKEWQKTTTPRRDLVKAGALILAEIERLDRHAAIERSEREGEA